MEYRAVWADVLFWTLGKKKNEDTYPLSVWEMYFLDSEV